MDPEPRDHAAGDADRRAVREADEHLLDQDAAAPVPHDLAELDAADDDRHRLGRGVPAHRHDDRNENRERDGRLERMAKERDDRRREQRRPEAREQPWQPAADRVDRAAVGAILGLDARQRVDVLGRLLANDVDDVVDGHDSDELVLLVDDRQRDQVVVGDEPRDLLLIRRRLHANQLGRHDLLERRRRAADDELAHAHDAEQVVALVDHVEVVGELELLAASLERRDRLRHRDLFVEREEVGRHDAPGGLRVEREELLHVGRLVGVHEREQLLATILWQFVEQERRVVRGHLAEEPHDLVHRKRLEQVDRVLGAELGQRVGGLRGVARGERRERHMSLALRERAEHGRHLDRTQPLDDVERVGDGAATDETADRIQEDVESLLVHRRLPRDRNRPVAISLPSSRSAGRRRSFRRRRCERRPCRCPPRES